MVSIRPEHCLSARRSRECKGANQNREHRLGSLTIGYDMKTAGFILMFSALSNLAIAVEFAPPQEEGGVRVRLG